MPGLWSSWGCSCIMISARDTYKETSAPIGEWKCNLCHFPPFWEIIIDRPTIQPTNQPTNQQTGRTDRVKPWTHKLSTRSNPGQTKPWTRSNPREGQKWTADSQKKTKKPLNIHKALIFFGNLQLLQASPQNQFSWVLLRVMPRPAQPLSKNWNQQVLR